MNELTKALERSNGVISLAHTRALRLKQAGALVDLSPGMGSGQLFGIRDNSADRQRYSAFRGWLYSAVNAIAQEAAGQPVHLGRMMDDGEPEEELGEERMRRPRSQKSWMHQRMTSTLRTKTADQEMEVLLNHPLLDVLEQPNPVQRRWQFVYNFIANLNLTGWSYVVGGAVEGGGVEFYCLPTTWVIPDHKNGPFSEFRIHNPKNPLGEVDQKPLTRDQVAFAYLPNPADPLGAMAPAQSQMNSIRIDDYIQSSQERFFENGIFPSVIVTVGKQPHPDVPGGVVPLLTGAQRRQIHTAIGRAMRGVSNYGNPAILDGLIERIDRLSMSQNEMGWEKSEQAVRTRILSAFGVHPYILGEPVNVGGYAQAAKIEERFCKRVNTFLDMLGCVMTSFAAPLTSVEDDLVIWWEETEPHDPSLHWQNIRHARDRDDISQNEYRAMLGLPPDEDRNESVIGSQAAQVVQLLVQVGSGAVDREQAMAFLEGMGLPTELADRIAGKQKEKQEVAQATETLQEAVRALRLDPKEIVGQIERSFKYKPGQPRVPAGSGAGGQFAGGGSGGGGGSTPSGGGGGGSSERLRDRIEGTQAEADNEVKKCNKAVTKASQKLDMAKSQFATAKKQEIKVLSKQLSEIRSRKSELESNLQASRDRIAALKAKLKKSQEDLLKELEGELSKIESVTADFRVLTDEAETFVKEVDTLLAKWEEEE